MAPLYLVVTFTNSGESPVPLTSPGHLWSFPVILEPGYNLANIYLSLTDEKQIFHT